MFYNDGEDDEQTPDPVIDADDHGDELTKAGAGTDPVEGTVL